MNKQHVFLLSIMSSALISLSAHAGVTTDAHGNQGYDTAAECDAAVQSGTAKFYTSFTTKPALKRAGETSVRVAKLSDVGDQYRLGACDMGAAKKLGRDGVSSALQGKYVPYSPDMAVNVYLNKAGQAVRVSMKQCDNWFSANAPRPVAPAAPKPVVKAPVVIPAVVAPVVAAVAEKSMTPYVFGSVGMIRDGVVYNPGSTSATAVDDKATSLIGGLGAGVQFNDLLGAELFMSEGKKQNYTATNGTEYDSWTHAHSLRATIGQNFTKELRAFGKLGIASVVHHDNDEHTSTLGTVGKDYLKRQIRPMAGLGLSYALTDEIIARLDYDHFFKRSPKTGEPKFKNADYLGLGLQYNF